MQNQIKILLTLCLLTMVQLVFSQNNSSTYDLRKKVMNTVKDYQNNGFQVIRVEMGELYKKRSVVILRELTIGKTFEIRAFTDQDRIKDITLKVYQKKQDNKWNLETQDISNIPGARVQFTPAIYDLYKITLAGYSFKKSNKGNYALVIAIMK